MDSLNWNVRKAQGAFDKGFAPRLRPALLTDWVCGTNLSTLKRERARAQRIDDPRLQAEREELQHFYLIAKANIWP